MVRSLLLLRAPLGDILSGAWSRSTGFVYSYEVSYAFATTPVRGVLASTAATSGGNFEWSIPPCKVVVEALSGYEGGVLSLGSLPAL